MHRAMAVEYRVPASAGSRRGQAAWWHSQTGRLDLHFVRHGRHNRQRRDLIRGGQYDNDAVRLVRGRAGDRELDVGG